MDTGILQALAAKIAVSAPCAKGGMRLAKSLSTSQQKRRSERKAFQEPTGSPW